MGIEILRVEQMVDIGNPYRNESGFRRRMHDHAAHALADKILETASVYQEIPPARGEPPYAKHRWSVGIERDVAEIEIREKQLEQAEKRGRMQAAAIAINMAERYEGLTGGCAGVIASALREAARKIIEA